MRCCVIDMVEMCRSSSVCQNDFAQPYACENPSKTTVLVHGEPPACWLVMARRSLGDLVSPPKPGSALNAVHAWRARDASRMLYIDPHTVRRSPGAPSHWPIISLRRLVPEP